MSWHLILERRLMQAFADGLFDDLPGAGRPLLWDDESLVPPSWRAAFRLLAQSGLAPEWITLDGEIRKDLQAARRSFASAAAHLDEDDPDYARAVERLARRLGKINAAIDELNLRIPSPQLSRVHLKPAREIERIRCGSPTPHDR
jgi:DnaJ family protein C protein 28